MKEKRLKTHQGTYDGTDAHCTLLCSSLSTDSQKTLRNQMCLLPPPYSNCRCCSTQKIYWGGGGGALMLQM